MAMITKSSAIDNLADYVFGIAESCFRILNFINEFLLSQTADWRIFVALACRKFLSIRF